MGFNPHPASRPDATHRNIQDRCVICKFQSSPGLPAGCNLFRATGLKRFGTFQSSPGLPAGCNIIEMNLDDQWMRFQSSPGLPAGCNIFIYKSELIDSKFQSSPGLPAGCNVTPCGHEMTYDIVSILTRPPGRMQRQMSSPLPGEEFQSSPGLPAGCNCGVGAVYGDIVMSFNPHPASRPDATGNAYIVRIHTDGFNPHPASRPDATAA